MLSTTTGHLHPGISTFTSGGAATPHKLTNSRNAHYATCSAMQEHKGNISLSSVSPYSRLLLAHLPQLLLLLLRQGVEHLCKLRLLTLLLEEVHKEGLCLIIAAAREAAAVFAECH